MRIVFIVIGLLSFSGNIYSQEFSSAHNLQGGAASAEFSWFECTFDYADLNNDGRIDRFGHFFDHDADESVFSIDHQDEEGEFITVQDLDLTGICKFLDCNGDSYPDLVLSGLFTTSRWYENLGDGTFHTDYNLFPNEEEGMTQAGPRFIMIADMNNDGLEDIVRQTSVGYDCNGFWYDFYCPIQVIQVMFNNANGSFSIDGEFQMNVPEGEINSNICSNILLEDLNGDEIKDVLWLGTESSYTLIHNGEGGLNPIENSEIIPYTKFSTALDINGDNHIDIVGVHDSNINSHSENYVITSYLGDGTGVFESGNTLAVPVQQVTAIHSFDFDMNGDDELYFMRLSAGGLFQVDYTLEEPEVVLIEQINTPHSEIVNFDFDQDGDEDIVLTGFYSKWIENIGDYEPGIIEQLDFDTDQTIGSSDLSFFLNEFGCESNCSVDLNSDGATTIFELTMFLSLYGESY